jgi:hypothetical protein
MNRSDPCPLAVCGDMHENSLQTFVGAGLVPALGGHEGRPYGAETVAKPAAWGSWASPEGTGPNYS